MSILHEHERLMAPDMNYQSYREIESKRKPATPFIPFLAMYLKDLTFANDGNSKTLENGLINFEKAWGVFDIVERIQQFQTPLPTIEKDDTAYDYSRRMIALQEKRLYKYSLLCEPRPATVSSDGSSVRLIDKWTQKK